MLRILFAGTPAIAARVLAAILTTPHQVVAVLTQPDRPAGRGQKLHGSPVKEVALQANIPIYQPESLKDDALLATLAAYQADVMVVLGYGMLLPESILEKMPLGAINFHVSLLPRWRGASPIAQAILAGDKETGISIMQIDKGLDTGPILKQFSCDISLTDTTETLTEKLTVLSALKTPEILTQLETGELIAQPQAQEGITYAHKIHKSEAQIDWHLPATVLARQIRAFNPWPIAFTHYKETLVRIWAAQVLEERCTDKPVGHILQKSEAGFDVVTGEGMLRITEIQLPGKGRIACGQLYKTAHPLFSDQGVFY